MWKIASCSSYKTAHELKVVVNLIHSLQETKYCVLVWSFLNEKPKNEWSNSDIFCVVAWINEIWKQALHFQSLFSFPSGGDVSYNQPAAHNPDIWCFHCSAHASALMHLVISLFSMSAPSFFFLLPVRNRGFTSSIISNCDKLQRASSREASLQVSLKHNSLPLAMSYFYRRSQQAVWGMSRSLFCSVFGK